MLPPNINNKVEKSDAIQFESEHGHCTSIFHLRFAETYYCFSQGTILNTQGDGDH
jgi:hypothetical protein